MLIIVSGFHKGERWSKSFVVIDNMGPSFLLGPARFFPTKLMVQTPNSSQLLCQRNIYKLSAISYLYSGFQRSSRKNTDNNKLPFSFHQDTIYIIKDMKLYMNWNWSTRTFTIKVTCVWTHILSASISITHPSNFPVFVFCSCLFDKSLYWTHKWKEFLFTVSFILYSLCFFLMDQASRWYWRLKNVHVPL